MLIRIVRMTFVPEKVATFLEIFDTAKQDIRNFENCHHLALLQDADNPTVFSTYSYWKDATALEKYRNSELFQTTWAKTKVLFATKPLAFSSYTIRELP